MSKLIHTALINAFLDMENDIHENIVTKEDAEIYFFLLGRKERYRIRLDELALSINSLDSNQLEEFNNLKETIREINELKAQRMTNEEIERKIEIISEGEESLPLSRKIILETYREVLNSRKSLWKDKL